MSGKLLKEKLRAGKTVYGTLFAHLTDPSIIGKLPEDTLDFIIVTPEHTAYDLAEFLAVRHACQARGIACLARTHGRDEADVAKVCDSFDGVVVPYVEDFENARRLAAAAIYRPLKGKRLDKVLATGEWPSDKTRDYIAEKNADTVFIPMIESIPCGRESRREFVPSPASTRCSSAPATLTANMGIPKEYDHPRSHRHASERSSTPASKHNIAAGSWFGTVPSRRSERFDQGARFVVYGNDGLLLISQAMDAVFPELKKG